MGLQCEGKFVTVEVRGTQRLFSLKYLIAEANIAKNFLLLEDDYNF